MKGSEVRWLVKDKDGVIRGPFSTSEVLKKIRSGRFYGEESLSKYPSGDWVPISYEETFFDALLSSLDQEMSVEDETSQPIPSTESNSATVPEEPKEPEETRRDWGDAIHPEKIQGTEKKDISGDWKSSEDHLRKNRQKGKLVSAEEEQQRREDEERADKKNEEKEKDERRGRQTIRSQKIDN